jgi:hypothetical protein
MVRALMIAAMATLKRKNPDIAARPGGVVIGTGLTSGQVTRSSGQLTR